MFEIIKKVIINASASSVYQTVSQLDHYHHWNPWVIECDNNAGASELTTVTVKLGKKTMKVKHKVLIREPNSRFVWCDTGWFTLFAYGERHRRIAEENGNTLYTVTLRVTGPLAFMAKWLYYRKLVTGLEAETKALKDYVEANKGFSSNTNELAVN